MLTVEASKRRIGPCSRYSAHRTQAYRHSLRRTSPVAFAGSRVAVTSSPNQTDDKRAEQGFAELVPAWSRDMPAITPESNKGISS